MKQFKAKKFFMGLAILALLVGLGGGQAVWADSKLAVGGGSPTVNLKFSVDIPTILYLQVGTVGTVDTVSCILSNIPGTGAVTMKSSGENPVPVRVAAMVPAGQKIQLLADSSNPLINKAGAKMPFGEISWKGGGSFSGGTFDNGSAQVLDTFGASNYYKGDYDFAYANANYYDSGTYNGQVTYTLALP